MDYESEEEDTDSQLATFDWDDIELTYEDEVRAYGFSVAEYNYECRIYNEMDRCLPAR